MIYLDYASTTPISKEILKSYMSVLESYYGNSDSLHDIGRECAILMEQSRAMIAQLFHVREDELLFTSGASEANNYAIKGFALQYKHRGNHIISSCIEHSSVQHSLQQLEKEFGFEVTYLPVNREGVVSLEDVKRSLRKDTILVSIMAVNNETGAIQPVDEICDYIHASSRAVFHCDCVQALGKIPVRIHTFDMASFSAHKIYGLKGSGLLYKKKNIQLLSLISAGQQEQGIRGGTSNAPANIILAKTIRLAIEEQKQRYSYVQKLNEQLRDAFKHMDQITINSSEGASPFILNVSCACIGSEIMLNALNTKGFAVSAQSTCASKGKARSHVLLAMGLGEERATHAIRISLSHHTTKEELTLFINVIKEIIHDYRTI